MNKQEELIKEALPEIFYRFETRQIPRGGKDYLERCYLEGKDVEPFQCGAVLHRFLASDDQRTLHNHPWKWAVSYILAGSYKERRGEICRVFREGDEIRNVELSGITSKTLKAGDHSYITQGTFHSVEILTDEVWTLFVHGPRKGRWGFIPAEAEKLHLVELVEGTTFETRLRPTRQSPES